MVLKWKRVDYIGQKEDIFYDEGSETLEQVAWRTYGCPIVGSVQGQVGRSFKQPDVVKDDPAYGIGVGLILEGPFQPEPFYDSMICVANIIQWLSMQS